METLKFKAIRKKETKDSSKVIRVDAEIYDAISYITLRTGIPTAQISNRLLDLALRHSEIEGSEDVADALEAYKKKPSKFQ